MASWIASGACFTTSNRGSRDKTGLWWLVKTRAGLIRIGWRARFVVGIDWGGDGSGFAWSFAAATDLLAELKKCVEDSKVSAGQSETASRQ
ncbi:hypothetical protein OpiT1DRAFT_05986 [Opitutaceae bacterium TAV1]|nr:hypothetical protein OpiT1DRAFT_05986 [Opitutaceae bacterium TAV1]